jgi:hypothetical protein
MILFLESFDYNAPAATRWNISLPGRSTGTVRTGTHSGTGNTARDIGSNLATVIVGNAFNKPSSGGLIRLFDGATEQLTVQVTAGLAIEVRRGNASGTILATSANGIFPLNAWNYVELKATINNSTGAFEVRLNGVPVPGLTLTGQDTQNTANAFTNRYSLDGTSFHDDHYLADTTGSAPGNDFLGDIRVETLYPNAAGDDTDYTPSAGSNFQNVDDAGTADGDTTYNQSTTPGDQDLFNLQSLATVSGIVYAVQPLVIARKTDSGAREIATVIKSGATEDVGPTHTLSTSYVQYDGEIHALNPDTGNGFTIAEVAALQAGYRTIT